MIHTRYLAMSFITSFVNFASWFAWLLSGDICLLVWELCIVPRFRFLV